MKDRPLQDPLETQRRLDLLLVFVTQTRGRLVDELREFAAQPPIAAAARSVRDIPGDPGKSLIQDPDHAHGQLHLVERRHDVDALSPVSRGEGRLLHIGDIRAVAIKILVAGDGAVQRL